MKRIIVTLLILLGLLNLYAQSSNREYKYSDFLRDKLYETLYGVDSRWGSSPGVLNTEDSIHNLIGTKIDTLEGSFIALMESIDSIKIDTEEANNRLNQCALFVKEISDLIDIAYDRASLKEKEEFTRLSFIFEIYFRTRFSEITIDIVYLLPY